MVKKKHDIIVLWKKPLVEIVNDCIFIEDQLVWKDGQFFQNNTIKMKTGSIQTRIGSLTAGPES